MNHVYLCSIAEGFQTGDIYVNDDSVDATVFFWHYCGFGYITGKASDTFLSEIYSEMVSCGNGRRLALITSDDDVIAFFRNKDVLMESRVEYSYLSQKEEKSIVADDFQIERIDSDNIHRIEGRIIPSFSWEMSEQFLKDGFGYVALDNDCFCPVHHQEQLHADVDGKEHRIGVSDWNTQVHKAGLEWKRLCENMGHPVHPRGADQSIHLCSCPDTSDNGGSCMNYSGCKLNGRIHTH